MNFTFRQLRIFLEVAESGSFTAASRRLYLTQPAVSMQVKQLEQAIGQPLLSKQGRRLILTDAGEEVLALSRSILQQVETASDSLNQIAHGLMGRLNLVVASTVSAVATQLLARFRSENPAMQVHFEVTNREGLLQQIDNNEADILLMGKPPDDLPIRAIAFMKNPLVVIAAPDHPLAHASTPVSVPELLQHDFVVREPGSGTRMAMERFFSQQEQQLDANMEVNSNEAIKQAVAAGLGLGVVSIHTLEAELKEGRLAVIEAEGFPLMRTWYLVQRRDKRLSPLAERFRDYVLEEAPGLETNP